MSLRKITSFTSLGAALEYYDFVIYATLAGYLSELFFPANKPQLALIKTLGIFAIGYLVRPLGGALFGSFGDRFGRKNVFIFSIALMAASTCTIGLLPTYSQVGIYAPIALLLCRILQGISFGAELPGAITFLSEHTQGMRSGLHIGWMVFGVSVGALLSSLLYTILSLTLDVASMHKFGWRIPFLLGGTLGGIVYLLRKNTHETPLFNPQNVFANTHLLILDIVKNNYVSLIIGTLVTLFGGSMIILYLFLPGYVAEFSNMDTAHISLAFSIGFLWSACLIPVCGILADIFSARRMIALTIFLVILCWHPMFLLLGHHGWGFLLAFTIIYQSFTASLAVSYSLLLAELFPTRVRYTGIAICYNTAFALAGFVPIIASVLLRKGYPLG